MLINILLLYFFQSVVPDDGLFIFNLHNYPKCVLQRPQQSFIAEIGNNFVFYRIIPCKYDLRTRNLNADQHIASLLFQSVVPDDGLFIFNLHNYPQAAIYLQLRHTGQTNRILI